LSLYNQWAMMIAALKLYFCDKLWLIWLLSPFLLLAATYLGSLAGSIVMLRQRKALDWFIFGLTIAYYLLIPGVFYNRRFWLPVMPLFRWLACVGWLAIWNNFQKIVYPLKSTAV
jgi:hypothetical protein